MGTVFIAVAYAGAWGSQDSFVVTERREYEGSRVEIKEQIARGALRRLEAEVASVDDD